MLLPLFLLFTLMPLLELWLLFKLSAMFGFLTTVSIVILTGMAGAALARMQGWLAITRIQTELRAGKMPAQAMGDGVLILVAGVLLITPGVITDIVGLSLLLPPVRILVRKGLQLWIAKSVKIQMQGNVFTNFSTGGPVGNDGRFDNNSGGPVDGGPVDEKIIVEGRVVDAHVIDSKVIDSKVTED